MKMRVTVRGQGLELRGFSHFADAAELGAFAAAMEPFGMVIASHYAEEFVVGEKDTTRDDGNYKFATAEQIAAQVLYGMTGTDPADGTPIGDLAASLDTGQVNAEDIHAALVDAVRIARGESPAKPNAQRGTGAR